MGKKNKLNAFWCFRESLLADNSFRRRFRNKQDLETEVGLRWKNMSVEEKEKFKAVAKQSNKSKEKLNCFGEPVREQEEKIRVLKEEKEEMEREIRSLVQHLNQDVEKLKEHVFYFVHTNCFYRSHRGTVAPAEVALSEFSLQHGIQRTYSTLLKISDIETGYAGIAKTVSETSHKIPVPGLEKKEDAQHAQLFNDDPGRVVCDIYKFLQGKEPDNYEDNDYDRMDSFMMFTAGDDTAINVVRECMATIVNKSGLSITAPFKIYRIELLYYYLCQTVADNNGQTGFISFPLATSYFEVDRYSQDSTTACEFHKYIDNIPHCSKSLVHRWGYTIADYCCNLLDIKMLAFKHCPKNADMDHLAKIQPYLSITAGLPSKKSEQELHKEYMKLETKGKSTIKEVIEPHNGGQPSFMSALPSDRGPRTSRLGPTSSTGAIRKVVPGRESESLGDYVPLCHESAGGVPMVGPLGRGVGRSGTSGSGFPNQSSVGRMGRGFPAPNAVGRSSMGRGFADHDSFERSSIGRGFADHDSFERSSIGRGFADNDAFERSSIGHGFSAQNAVERSSMGRGFADNDTFERSSIGRGFSVQNAVERSSIGRGFADLERSPMKQNESTHRPQTQDEPILSCEENYNTRTNNWILSPWVTKEQAEIAQSYSSSSSTDNLSQASPSSSFSLFCNSSKSLASGSSSPATIDKLRKVSSPKKNSSIASSRPTSVASMPVPRLEHYEDGNYIDVGTKEPGSWYTPTMTSPHDDRYKTEFPPLAPPSTLQPPVEVTKQRKVSKQKDDRHYIRSIQQGTSRPDFDPYSVPPGFQPREVVNNSLGWENHVMTTMEPQGALENFITGTQESASSICSASTPPLNPDNLGIGRGKVVTSPPRPGRSQSSQSNNQRNDSRHDCDYDRKRSNERRRGDKRRSSSSSSSDNDDRKQSSRHNERSNKRHKGETESRSDSPSSDKQVKQSQHDSHETFNNVTIKTEPVDEDEDAPKLDTNIPIKTEPLDIKIKEEPLDNEGYGEGFVLHKIDLDGIPEPGLNLIPIDIPHETYPCKDEII